MNTLSSLFFERAGRFICAAARTIILGPGSTRTDYYYYYSLDTLFSIDSWQFYLVLVVWSPPPIVMHESEKKYVSYGSKKPKPLPSLTDPCSVDLTVVIPAYNETARLPSMLSTTVSHLDATKKMRTYEILIVNDGSSDDTSAVALKLANQYSKSDIRVVTLEKNLGKGGAVRHGMLFGRGRRLLMVDADGASRFEDLELLWKTMDDIVSADDSAVVIGSRAHLVKTEAVVKVSILPLDLKNIISSSSTFSDRCCATS